MEIKSLNKISFDRIYEVFSEAFIDYELQLNEGQLQAMLKRRGFIPELSFAAFDGSKIVAFTFNGIGSFNGILTAYDTGTGTLKEYRGRGLATQIFEYSIPYLEKEGIKQYLLEVLQHNTKAVSVYKNLGFEVTREFNYFIQKKEEVHNILKAPDTSYSVDRIDIERLDQIPAFWDFYPSWQNSFESIRRSYTDFVSLGLFSEQKLIGYCVFEPVSGDITQIAIDKKQRRKGAASLLLQEMLKVNKNEYIKILNTDVTCDSITGFSKAKNIAMKGQQFEMVRKI